MRLTKAGWPAPMGAVVTGLVAPLYAPAPMSVHDEPPFVLISTTPPSHPVASKEKRCRNEMTRGAVPTCMVGETSPCSSGRSAFSPSVWPLLSGPQKTCWAGERGRGCQGLMLGEVVASPETVQPWAAASTDSVADVAGLSS